MGVAADIDEQVAQHAVDQPGRNGLARIGRRNLPEGDFHFIQRIVARLVDARRLAGRPDEQAGEQVGQAGMVVPVGDQAAQQVRPAEEGRIVRRGAAEHEMVAAAGAGVAAVHHEFLGGQARVVGRFVEVGGLLDQLRPGLGRVDVDLDDAGVRRDAEMRQARIGRRLVAFQDDRQLHFFGRRLDGGDDFEVVLQLGSRRHEDVELAVARFGAHGQAGDPGGGLLETGQRVARLIPGVALAESRAGYPHLGVRRLPATRRRPVIGVAGQRGLGHFGVGRIDVGVVALRRPRLRVERQAIAERRIAGNQVAVLGTQEPRAALPLVMRILHDRQHVADGVGQALREHLGQPFALQRIIDPRIEGIDIARQAALAPQVVVDVLIGREDMLGRHPQALGHPLQEAAGLLGAGAVVLALVGIQGRGVPERLAILAPEAVQGPARQLLAGIPLALAEVHQAVGGVFFAQAVEQFGGVEALGRAEGGGIPLGAIRVVAGHEGRLAALGQAHVHRLQLAVDGMAELFDFAPLFVAVGLGDARRFPDPGDLHVMGEFGFARVDAAGHRGGGSRLGGTGQRDVALAGKQAGGRIEADPAGTGQVDFGPGMQVGEIGLRAGGAVERLDVGRQLDQVAGHETRRQAEMAQDLHQQPGRVAAGAGLPGQRFLGRLHPRLHPDGVADIALHLGVEGDQEIDAALLFQGNGGHIAVEQLAAGNLVQIRRQLVALPGFVLEGEFLGMRFEEEVERIDHRHLGHQIDLETEFAGLFREDQAGQVVALRVLLPIDEMRLRRDFQRVGEDAGARVRAGPQADDLRAEIDQPVVGIMRDVVEGDVDGHGWAPGK